MEEVILNSCLYYTEEENKQEVLTGTEEVEAAGMGLVVFSKYCCVFMASLMPGKRLSYWDGSARVCAIFSPADCFHTSTTRDTSLGMYVL